MKYTHLLMSALCCWWLACGSVRADESDMAEPPHLPPAVAEEATQRSGVMAAQPLSATVNEISVLFLYTPDDVRVYGSASAVLNRINTLVNVTNAVYSNSGVNLHLNKAGQLLVQYDNSNSTATAFTHLADKSHFAFAQVNQKRMQVQADFVVLLRPYKNDGLCGKAYFLGNIPSPASNYWALGGYAYAHVSINCSDDVLPHELGHLMGLAHSRQAIGETAAGKAYPFGAGYGVYDDFIDVMAHHMTNQVAVYGSNPLPLARFSAASQACVGRSGIAKACGVDSSLSNGADAVLAINNIAAQLPHFSDDSDSDGMPDWFEFFWGLDRFNAADASTDADGDGLSNLREFYAETYAKPITGIPVSTDTDGDGIADGADPYPAIVGTPLVIFGLDGTYRGGKIEERVQSD